MNKGNKGERTKLTTCPACGLDSGERVQSTAPPFYYYVRCTSCGAVTQGYAEKNVATKMWKKGNVKHV